VPRLDLQVHAQDLSEEDLRRGILFVASDTKAMEFEMAMVRLMKSGDFGYYLSARLVKALKSYGAKKGTRAGGEEPAEVDAMLFFSWLEEVGSMEPPVKWDIESLPDNGGIYRMLLQGEHDEQGTHDHPSQ
jgi:hypothetical protein